MTRIIADGVSGVRCSYCRFVSLLLDGEPLLDEGGLLPCHAWSGVLGPLIGERAPPESLEPVLLLLSGLAFGAVAGLLLSRPRSDRDRPSVDCCANDIELPSTSTMAMNVAVFIRASRRQTNDAESTVGITASCL